jgi:hypothetical protein
MSYLNSLLRTAEDVSTYGCPDNGKLGMRSAGFNPQVRAWQISRLLWLGSHAGQVHELSSKVLARPVLKKQRCHHQGHQDQGSRAKQITDHVICSSTPFVVTGFAKGICCALLGAIQLPGRGAGKLRGIVDGIRYRLAGLPCCTPKQL